MHLVLSSYLFFCLGIVSPSRWPNLAALQTVQPHFSLRGWLWLARSWSLHAELWAKGELFPFFWMFIWLLLSKNLSINSEWCHGHFKSIGPALVTACQRSCLWCWAERASLQKPGAAGPREHTGSHFLWLPKEGEKLCWFCIPRGD